MELFLLWIGRVLGEGGGCKQQIREKDMGDVFFFGRGVGGVC